MEIILNLDSQEATMDKVDLFTNLLAVAMADGKFTQEEVNFLMVRAEDWQIEPETVEAILAAAQSEQLELTIPDSREDRIELMREMIHLMAVDGELAEVEKRLCATASAAMDFSAKEFNQILDSLLADE